MKERVSGATTRGEGLRPSVVVDRHGPPRGDAWLSPRERRTQAGLRLNKRRREWRHGRWVGKRALVAALQATGGETPPYDHLEILPAADGAPEAFFDGRPLPLTLSLSHSGGLAAAAVAPGGVALGCDLELLEPRSDRLIADHFTAAEADRVRATPDAATATLLTNLTWSAKEATLKALRTGLRRDTRGVEVEVEVEAEVEAADDVPDGDRRPPRWHPLTITDRTTGAPFTGLWQRLGNVVLTVVADTDLGTSVMG